MNKTLVAVTIVFCAGVLGAFALFLQYNRYQLTQASIGAVYKIDRRTGRTWIVVANREVDVLEGGNRSAAPAESGSPAIDLGKAAFQVNQFVKLTLVERVKKTVIPELGVSVEAYIGSRIAELTRPIELVGWDAEEKKTGVWVVSYRYSEGKGAKGYYFEVEAAGGGVQFIAQDTELEKFYGLECKKTLCAPHSPEIKDVPAEKSAAKQ